MQSIFFPRPGTTARYDPVMRALRQVQCKGTTGGGDKQPPNADPDHPVRDLQHRGVWIAKRLKRLWNAGCNVKIIYAVTSRPVLAILRSRAGRGPIPMRQSVIRNAYGEIVKYNHNKWMTITGHWGSSTRRLRVFAGSSNWGNLAFTSDEQMQQIRSYRAHPVVPDRVSRRPGSSGASRRPGAARVYSFGRMLPGAATPPSEIPEEPVFGEGIYKYLPED